MIRPGTIAGAAAFFWLVCMTPPAVAADTPVQEVIRGRAHWSGAVTIDGIVIVTGTGELAIEAGTTVSFVPRDDDGDGVGDSELRVEGQLLVTGTRQRPVVFTSAAPVPAPADWKYVMINHARGAEMSHARFEYAFSGIQIHYTRGSFRDLVSRHCVDGFRFSTAPVTLTGSVLVHNVNGIRFEERGAGARIAGNVIENNEVGIFAVTRCAGLTVFTGNSVANNSDYNVKMGHRQTEDVPVQDTWWGSTDPRVIEAGFFDQRLEPALGRVHYRPWLGDRPSDLPVPDP